MPGPSQEARHALLCLVCALFLMVSGRQLQSITPYRTSSSGLWAFPDADLTALLIPCSCWRSRAPQGIGIPLIPAACAAGAPVCQGKLLGDLTPSPSNPEPVRNTEREIHHYRCKDVHMSANKTPAHDNRRSSMGFPIGNLVHRYALYLFKTTHRPQISVSRLCK